MSSEKLPLPSQVLPGHDALPETQTTSEQLSPSDRATRISRTILLGILTITYSCFLYFSPTGRWSPSTIAVTGEIYAGVLRSCKTGVCSDWLQGEGSRALSSVKLAQGYLAAEALIVSALICHCLSFLSTAVPKDTTLVGTSENLPSADLSDEPKLPLLGRIRKWFSELCERSRKLAKIMTYMLVPLLLLLYFIVCTDAISHSMFNLCSLGSINLGLSTVLLAFQCLMPDNLPSREGRHVVLKSFFCVCYFLSKALMNKRLRKKDGSPV